MGQEGGGKHDSWKESTNIPKNKKKWAKFKYKI